MNQHQLNNYFSRFWNSRLETYKYSGLSLVDRIAPEEHVLDVGCGRNPFKTLIPNLVGIDPAFSEADVQTTIEEYKTDQLFDVAFCLGSINFGTEDQIIRQIEAVIALLKPQARIYWRCNPGLNDHPNLECSFISFYPWNVDRHQALAERYGFQVVDVQQDTNNRIYVEWRRA